MFKPVRSLLRSSDPFENLFTIQERINKVFNDLLPSSEVDSTSRWVPAIDVFEKEGNIEIELEAPGIKEEDLKIKIEDGMLIISGERKFEKEDKKENYYRMERSYGSFSRSFSLPDNVERDKIGAKYENGLLKITLPKKPESQPKEIPVNFVKEIEK
ncbi:Hsp20/alpha crystallin family protein [Thermodesulfobium sp. 4217-1]|uniref:Hsp20/alpha crystallin family protein n=1 Tax=Thermodesulfobium sp. 4217-1 TaxID=3120013 RepID=UPI0032220AB8